MSDEFVIKDVPYYSQRDNVQAAYTSCFPTSLAMCMAYCLNLIGKTKIDVGCAENVQLEDYIYSAIQDEVTTQWMKDNVGRLGTWIWQYNSSRRYLFVIEEYIFNRFMNKFGFKARFKEGSNYEEICTTLEANKLPGVIGGNFSSVSSVGGHMNVCLGYNKIGVAEFVVNDPFGNCMKRYEDVNGAYLRYRSNFYFTNNNGAMNIIFIEKA